MKLPRAGTDPETSTGPVRSRYEQATFSVAELAARTGVTEERIKALASQGVISPVADGRYEVGDVHRLRALTAFEAAGVPVDVLVRAQQGGEISFAYYDELHATPGPPSSRTYDDFKTALGDASRWLTPLFAAFGLAEPEAETHLDADHEGFLADLARNIDAIRHPDLALRVVRLFGEATRRASDAALTTYAEVVHREGTQSRGLPSQEEYDRVFRPWAQMARSAPRIASWLTMQHISRAIDAYSVEATEQVLEDAGYVPERPEILPAIAFADLTGFTQLAEEKGDEAAAHVALRLNELASAAVAPHGGRVIKLLGDGVLARFASLEAAVRASLDLLDALGEQGLPAGHVGVHCGPVIARDGDVYGRTVNMAARIADAAPPGALYLASELTDVLPDDLEVEAVDGAVLQGIGEVRLSSVRRKS